MLLQFLLKLFAPIIDYVATNHRALAMTVVVLPLSFLMRCYMAASDVLYAAFMSDPGAHDKRVKRIQRDVKARLSRPISKRKKMCTARAPWQNLSTRFADYKKDDPSTFKLSPEFCLFP